MFSPELIWSMIGGGAVVVFSAGAIAEKMRNGKYVAKDVCKVIHKAEDERWNVIVDELKFIRLSLENMNGHHKK